MIIKLFNVKIFIIITLFFMFIPVKFGISANFITDLAAVAEGQTYHIMFGGMDAGGNYSGKTYKYTTTGVTGASLYSQYCASCHGANGKQGATAAQISAAISSNTGGMGNLSFLTATQIQDISNYLNGCTYTISPTSQTLASTGGTYTVTVTASQASCTWAASSNINWATITSGNSGTGSGTVVFSVSANTTGAARTANLTIAGQTFTLTQSSGNQPVSLIVINPASQSYFDTIQAAYAANTAASGSAILAQGVTLTENLSFNQNNTITLTGGYDSSFSAIGGTMTTIQGSMTILGGTVTIANIVIK